MTQNPDGGPNLRHSGGHLHSVRNPEKEAERFAAEILKDLPPDPETPLLVLGLGWGRHLPALQSALSSLSPAVSRPLFYYEPIAEVREILENEGRLAQLRATGAIILNKPADLRKALESAHRSSAPDLKPLSAPRLYILPSYRRLFPDLAEDFQKELARAREGGQDTEADDVEQSTRAHFMRGWTRNFFRKQISSTTLRFLGANQRAKSDASSDGGALLFIGAGPDLERDLQIYARRLQTAGPRELLILVADTALAPTLARGIRPDLIVSVDSGPGTAYHFQAAERVLNSRRSDRDRQTTISLADIPALSWLAGPVILPRYLKRTFFYRSTFPFDQLLGAGPLKDLPEWENDSLNTQGLALLFAHWLGRKHVYTLAADFRSRRGQSHARGTGYCLYALEKQSRTHPREMYRPGGYGTGSEKGTEGQSEKNRRTLQGLKEMGRRLGLELKPLSEWPRVRTDNINTTEDAETRLCFPETAEFSTAELRGYLRWVWERVNRTEIPGLSERDWKKWKKMLS